jgi:tetratricopeptide (TPR) repeat protein
MLDINNFSFDPNEEEEEESYPEFFYKWDENLDEGNSPGYLDTEELSEIIEIYLNEGELPKAKTTVNHALKIYPDNEDLIYDILLLLNDYEMWNDLLDLSLKYENMSEVWPDGHRITALLHLGMEEDAFHYFRKMKTKYAGDEENLSIIYQAMGEALYEVDLYDASVDVMKEAVQIIGKNIDFYWLQLHSHVSLEDKEKVIEIGDVIAKMNPFGEETWHRLGIAYKDINELEMAIEALEFAKNLGLKSKENFINLIHTYEQNGNYSKALENAKEFLYLYPDNYLINIIASNICSYMEMWKEAIEFLDEAIKIMPFMDSLYLHKSAFYLYLGEQQKSKFTLTEGILKTSDPDGDLEKELKRLNELYPNI